LLACGGPSAGEDQSGESESTATSGDGDGDASESETDGETTGTPDLPDESPPLPDPMVVMTFNILCSFCDDTYDPWDDRLGYMADTIARHDPDLFGLQELFTADEVQQLLDLMPGYEVLYFMDELTDYADASIWWRADRYELVDSGFYWLSPAPDTPFSVGFADMQFPRIVAWAHMRELATQGELLFVTTHFDNNSPSQELSAPLLLERTELQAGELPIVVVGDFNSKPDTVAYGILTNGVDGQGFALTNSFDLADSWSVESNQDPAPAYDVDSRIDHIFVAGGAWSVPSWVVDTWIYGPNDLPTSDHFAMVAELVAE
jgi:endonuclease/exonuclease/phosphatase family metal-dependent hydrolase